MDPRSSNENIDNILLDAWSRIHYFNGGSLQLAISHPLTWHVAYETENNKALVIISKFPLRELDSSRCIAAECNVRDDQKYYISFRLIDNSQEDVFITMCSDIIKYSKNTTDEKNALDRVSIRYQQWKKLMEKSNPVILSDEKRRGLIAELLYLKEELNSNQDFLRVIKGWVGPDGADQDFVYNEKWHEIKATMLSSDKVTIHSVEQLGRKNESGELIIYRIDKCAPEMIDAITLNSLIDDIENMIISTQEGSDLLKSKLLSIGYLCMPEYDKYSYKCFGKKIYAVQEGFPRLTRDDIVAEIVNCEYVISIPGIDAWKKG